MRTSKITCERKSKKSSAKQPTKGGANKSPAKQQKKKEATRRPLSEAKESFQSDLQLPPKAKNQRESVEKTLVWNIAY
jgi:hypothetical protein